MSLSPTTDERTKSLRGGASAGARPRLRLLTDPDRWSAFRELVDLLALVLGATGTLLIANGDAVAQTPPTAMFALCALVLISSRRSRHKQLAERILDSCGAAVAACAVAAMAALALGALIGESGAHLFVLRQWLITVSMLCAARTALGLIAHRARSRGLLMTPTLIVGAGIVGNWVVRRLATQPALGLRPVGFLDADPKPGLDGEDLPVLGAPANALEVAQRTGARQLIFAFSWERDRELAEVVRRCQAAGLEVAIIPRLYETINERITVDHVGGLPLMSLGRIDLHGWQFSTKYAIERLAALACLLAVAPLMAAIALAVRVSSRGSALYRQRRVGRGGREFDLLKFRSMTPHAGRTEFSPADGSAPGGVEGADRRTRIGRWLRNTSLDELPQLINVLRGEMSLIGPRPERPEYAARFAVEIPGYGERHRVKPGITGWAQVNGLRGQTSITDRVEWDNHYIDNWSLRLELRTLALTLAAIFSFREEQQQAALTASPTSSDLRPEPPPRRRDESEPSPRPVLTVLDTAGEQATHWFCGYCGAPAASAPPSPLLRVCTACTDGVLLEAPADAAPRAQDAFLVVDSRLTVQAVSRQAEQILGVREETVTDQPVTELIADAESELDCAKSFASAIAQTALSDEAGWSAFVRPRDAFGIRMRARITHCGPPRAALIVLEQAASATPRLRLVRTAPAQAEDHAR